jgi:hypothetical protein
MKSSRGTRRFAAVRRGRLGSDTLNPAWAILPVISLGLLSWAVFLLVAVRTGARRYRIVTAVYLAVAVVAGALVAAKPAGHSWVNDAAGFLFILLAGGGAVHVLASRSDYTRLMSDPRLLAAEQRADLRARALAMVRDDPRRALELGVGRPDVEGAFDAGLVDCNHAGVKALERLPGIGPALAARIIDLRGASGFRSLEDLDLVLDLDEPTLARLREVAVFIPDS